MKQVRRSIVGKVNHLQLSRLATRDEAIAARMLRRDSTE